MKCKSFLFDSYNYSLDVEINRWLDETPGIKIVNIHTSDFEEKAYNSYSYNDQNGQYITESKLVGAYPKTRVVIFYLDKQDKIQEILK